MNRLALLHAGVLISLAANVGCTTLAVNVPNAMIESPEIQSGPGKFDLGLGFDDATNYTYTSDANRRPPDLGSPQIKTDLPYMFGRAGYAFFDWLEIGLRILPGSRASFFFGGIGATARVQLVGNGTGPGLKVAIYGGGIQTSSSSGGDQNANFGPAGYNWRANASGTTLTGGASVGVRFDTADLLVFIAGAYADQSVTGTITHDLSDNGTSPAASYSLPSVKGSSRTAALGFRAGKTVRIGFDMKQIYQSWPGLSSPETRGGGETTHSAYAFSLAFGY